MSIADFFPDDNFYILYDFRLTKQNKIFNNKILKERCSVFQIKENNHNTYDIKEYPIRFEKKVRDYPIFNLNKEKIDEYVYFYGPFITVSEAKFYLRFKKLKEYRSWIIKKIQEGKDFEELVQREDKLSWGEKKLLKTYLLFSGNIKKLQKWEEKAKIKRPEHFL